MKQYPILPTLILTALAAGTLWQSALAEEPSRRPLATPPAFIPFEVFAKHREALGLSEAQVKELSRVAEGMGDAARKLEGERRERTEALQAVIAQRPIEVERAMERFQAVLKIEDEMKALQFRSGLAAQNLLDPEQTKKMQAIAAKMQGSREGVSPGLDANALREKLEQLRGELRKRSGGELSKEAGGTIERIEQAAQQGRVDEARKQMEGLFAQLGGKGKAPGNAQPSASDLKDAASKTKAKLAEVTDPQQREQLQQQLAKIQSMQDRLAANSEPSGREKSAFKGEGETKGKGDSSERKEKAFAKPDGEDKEKVKQSDGADKAPVKGEGEVKGKFDKNAEGPKRVDPELRKRVDSVLAEFQEAKAAGNREGMERSARAIESLLRENARDGGSGNDGPRKDGDRKEGAKDGARKEAFGKDAPVKE